MNLVKERNQWHKDFETEPLDSIVLQDYARNRHSEYWRTSREVERLCEYILFLEKKVSQNNP